MRGLPIEVADVLISVVEILFSLQSNRSSFFHSHCRWLWKGRLFSLESKQQSACTALLHATSASLPPWLTLEHWIADPHSHAWYLTSRQNQQTHRMLVSKFDRAASRCGSSLYFMVTRQVPEESKMALAWESYVVGWWDSPAAGIPMFLQDK